MLDAQLWPKPITWPSSCEVSSDCRRSASSRCASGIDAPACDASASTSSGTGRIIPQLSKPASLPRPSEVGV